MNPNHDLAVYQAMAAELSDYLLSDTLFWQMQATSEFPRLSLGALLLTRARLRAAAGQMPAGAQAELGRADREVEALLAKWPVAAERKSQQELRSRVRLWQQFLADCQQEPSACGEDYAQEVTQRLTAALLLRQFPRLVETPEARALAPLDAQLRGRFSPGPFIWPAELRGELPQSDFWFMYGRPG